MAFIPWVLPRDAALPGELRRIYELDTQQCHKITKDGH